MTYSSLIHLRRGRALRLVALGGLGQLVLLLNACGPDSYTPAPPSLEWNQQRYGVEPAHRPLSSVVVTTEAGWVVAREKPPGSVAASAGAPVYCMAHLRIGGMDCGDCQHLVADQLGMVAGVRQARISQPEGSAAGTSNPSRESLWAGQSSRPDGSQSQPEAVVEYDPSKVSPKQIEGSIASLGLLPQPLP